MKILVIGGTIFLGRHVVDVALARGHDVTLFNRGNNKELFPHLEQIHGNRDGGIAALGDRHFDFVVDTCGYVPRIVKQSAEYLASRASRYIFISSISVYPDLMAPGLTEESPVGTMPDETLEQVTNESYGPLKVLCEKAAEEAFAGRSVSVRAGLIVGPHDRSDRFTYWVRRMAQGGEVLAPEPRDQKVEFIDVRDLAAFIVKLGEDGATGPFNASGPADPPTMEELLKVCSQIAGVESDIRWTPAALLNEEGIVPWVQLPLWLGGEPAGSIVHNRAIQAGITWRRIEDTIAATLEWDRDRWATLPRNAITPEQERTLLIKAQSWG